jgi:exodeoxyribonuclease VII large subunit
MDFGPEFQERVFTVSTFLDYINEFLTEEHVAVTGEVTGVNVHSTGVYFSIKEGDDGKGGPDALLECYMAPFAYRQMGVELQNGMEIKANGSPSIFKKRGRFSFRVTGVTLVGEGALRKAYEVLKAKLEAEGVFAQKRAIPEFISTIGVITSKTGAVIDDFRKNLEPLGFKIMFADTRVEGAQAVEGIVSAIETMNSLSTKTGGAPDVIVIIRGGGSLEDLQAFNNERVARAIFASKIPTLCGIGHDRDVPIASLVADRAVSTPSIAAGLMNSSWNVLKSDVPLLAQRLAHAMEGALTEQVQLMPLISQKLIRHMEIALAAPQQLVARGQQILTSALMAIARSQKEATERLLRAAESAFARTRKALDEASRYLAAVSPERNLKLGYSIIFGGDGRVVKGVADLKKGEEIRARVTGGELTAEIKTISHDAKGQ